MKKINLLVFCLFVFLNQAFAQIFKTDTLQYKGNTNKHINIVILGDGYTASEQIKFNADAKKLIDYLFKQAPWSNYVNYFNVFTIEVISLESGVKHPKTSSECSNSSTVSNPDNYFGTSFDSFGIHRLVVPGNMSLVSKVLAFNFPLYDQAILLANSPDYGGSGGTIATATNDGSSNEVVAHELGHSFAKLADEYFAGFNYAQEAINMTKETDKNLVRWKNWIGYKEVGVYNHCCGTAEAEWHKPHEKCKMQSLNKEFCSVCQEGIVEKIHSLTKPIVSYEPSANSINSANQLIDFKLIELTKPTPNTLNIEWKLDNIITKNKAESFTLDQNTLTNGSHTLAVTVVDTTTLLRVDKHTTLHFNTVVWTINKTATTGTQLLSAENKISYSVFPNPSSSVLNIEMELEKPSKVMIQLISIDGKIVQTLENQLIVNHKYNNIFNIEQLPIGTYNIVFKIDDVVRTQTFVKQ